MSGTPTGRTPAPCHDWCGKHMACNRLSFHHDAANNCYCSDACREAGKPLNPAKDGCHSPGGSREGHDEGAAMTRAPQEEARRVARAFVNGHFGMVEKAPHGELMVDRLTTALTLYLAALEAARGGFEYLRAMAANPYKSMDTGRVVDAQRVDEVAEEAMEKIAALLGQPGRTE